MESSKPIDLEYSRLSLVTLLAYGSRPDESPYRLIESGRFTVF
jgi:hypothetical protein